MTILRDFWHKGAPVNSRDSRILLGVFRKNAHHRTQAHKSVFLGKTTMKGGLLLLFSALQAAYSYPTGAGSCIGGQAAVGSPHRNSSTITEDNLFEQGWTVTIDDAPFDPSMVFETNQDYNISVNAGIFGNSRGILIRLESSNPETEMFLEAGENTESASVCANQTGVQGLTHFNNTQKKVHSGTFRVTNPDTVQLDITAVLRNDATLSLFRYGGFQLTFGAANTTEPETVLCFVCGSANATMESPSTVLNLTDGRLPSDIPASLPTTCSLVEAAGKNSALNAEQCTFFQTDVTVQGACQCSGTQIVTDAPVPAPTLAPVPAPTDSPRTNATDPPVANVTAPPVTNVTDPPAPTDAPVSDLVECNLCSDANMTIGDEDAVIILPDGFLPPEIPSSIPTTCRFIGQAAENKEFDQAKCTFLNTDDTIQETCQCSAGNATSTEAPTFASPTATPTTAAPVTPTVSPTKPPPVLRTVELEVPNLEIVFQGVSSFTADDQNKWIRVTKTWFNDFYSRPRQGASNMISNIVNVRPELKSGFLKVVYDHIMLFEINDESLALADDQYVYLPFRNQDANDDYADELRDLGNFRSLQTPIAVPQISNGGGGSSDGLSAGAIAGIAIGGAVGLLLLIGLLLFWKVRKQLNNQDNNNNNKISVNAIPEQHDPESAYNPRPTFQPSVDSAPEDPDTYVVLAPAGKLQIVLDKFDDEGPVVIVVKEGSPVFNKISLGDRLVGVDEVDVRAMSPTKVSKLIAKRAANEVRSLKLRRGDEVVSDDEDGR